MPQRIPDNFEVRKPRLLDNKEGPWSSVEEATLYITKDIRAQGQVVKILNAGSIEEWWWKDGIEDIDLIAKVSGGGGGDMFKATYDIDNDGVVDSAETVKIIVRNSTGSTLTKGQIVYLSGATGNRPNAILSDATDEITSSKTIGMVAANIANNSDGYVAVSGTLHDIDTSAFTAGDSLWLSETAGAMQANTPPAEPAHSVFIGYVARSHPTQGRIVLAIQNGYELTELHGVTITSPATNDFLYYASDGIWKNKQLSKSDVGLGNVPNTDATNPANITQSASYRFVTDTEKSTWNGKQNALTNPVTGTGTNNEIAVFNTTGSTITSLSTSTYPSLTELSYVKGLTSAIQTQINALPRVVYTNVTEESTSSTSATNLLSTFGFTISDANWPVGGVLKIIGFIERTAGTGSAIASVSVNSSSLRYVGASGQTMNYEYNLMKISSTQIRIGYGPSNTGNGSYQPQNTSSVVATVSGGNYVLTFGLYVGTSTTFAQRWMKAIMIP